MIRKLIACLIAPALVLIPATAQEDGPKHPLRPLLWKVEGNGLEKPSWLFGTIHLGEGPLGKLHPAADKALAGSDVVYTEVSMDPATQLGMAKHFMRTDGKTLSASIGEELTKQLEAELAAVQPGLTSGIFQSFKTWAVAVTIPLLKAQLGGSPPVDRIVWDKATEAGKGTVALEKPEDQFGIFDDLKEEEQIIFLSESLRLQKESRGKEEDPVAHLVEAYVSGDPKKIEGAMEHQMNEMAKGEHKELGEKLLKRLLQDRNVTMAKTMAERMKVDPAKSHFFAVGAGHYLGKGNIVGLLTDRGYTVTLANP
ncbi:transfer protein GumN [Haloferula helveola]|uniref:Transfer protein GumN n=1 Tax=Haloferula helveola TaxID=490095 RepID=A0ABN6H167_9BACT|nr:transfer protein GumN [Haloferula helveola]